MNISVLFFSRVSSRSSRIVRVIGHYHKVIQPRVTFATADSRFFYDLVCFCTVCGDFYLRFGEKECFLKFWGVNQVFTGVCQKNIWNGALFTQARRPFQVRVFKQAALLMVTAAIIIPIKIFAFFSCRCSHKVRLHAGDVIPSSGIDPDHIAFFNKCGDRYFQAGLGLNLFIHAGGSIAAHSRVGPGNF